MTLDEALAYTKEKLPDHLVLFREVHPDHRNSIFPKAWMASIQSYTTAGGWGKGRAGHGDTAVDAILDALNRT